MPPAMRLFALRGAITVEENDRASILAATARAPARRCSSATRCAPRTS